MQIERRKMERALARKGFVEEESHHRYFYHEHNGKRSGAYTYTSRGKAYKTYGVALLKRIRSELKLDSIQQVMDLFKCPMSASDYNDVLRGKSLLPPSKPSRNNGGKKR